MTTKPKADATTRAMRINVEECVLNQLEGATTATADTVLAVHRTARFMGEAITGGHVDQNDVAAYLALVVRATDPEPKACFEDAGNLAFRASRSARKATEGEA
jgi:hypothetical protein